MIELGRYHTLKIDHEASPGLFLQNEEGEEILLPNKYVPEEFEIGGELEVFVYLDHSERPVATTLKPRAELDEFANLRCVETNEIGAFLDWGLEKHLFVPHKEQAYPMKTGNWYLIFCYLDESTDRLVGSSKVHAFLDNDELTVEPFEKVDLIVTSKTDLGFHVIVNELHLGLIYHDLIFQPLKTGDKTTGWITKIREDNKIDISLQRPGYRSIEPNADAVMEKLQHNDGYLPLHDKSDPDKIQEILKMSKKSFKRASGTLFKKRLIDIKNGDGIYLREK